MTNSKSTSGVCRPTSGSISSNASWDSLDDQDVPVTEQQKAELDRRIDEMDRNGNAWIPWEEVLLRIRGRSE